jgi:hypothetical protein
MVVASAANRQRPLLRGAVAPMNVEREAHARLAHNRPLSPSYSPRAPCPLVCILDTVLLGGRGARVLSAARRGPKRCCRIHGGHQPWSPSVESRACWRQVRPVSRFPLCHCLFLCPQSSSPRPLYSAFGCARRLKLEACVACSSRWPLCIRPTLLTGPSLQPATSPSKLPTMPAMSAEPRPKNCPRASLRSSWTADRSARYSKACEESSR